MLRLPQAVAAVCDRRSIMSAVTDRCYSICVLLFALTFTFPLTLGAAESSEPAPLASRSLLLDVTRAGQRLVAVGDRGHVLLSDDEGGTWRQVIVPTRAMLTGASFGDAQHGWTVGHDGVILATANAGQTWTAQASTYSDLETIFLDVQAADAQRAIAIGAYGKAVVTADGGKTWMPSLPVPEEVHLNQVVLDASKTQHIAGENGTLLVRDTRKGWRKLPVPYDGSLYGVMLLGEHSLLVYGLRGHVFTSDDDGETWAERATPAAVLIMAGVRLKSGVIVLAGLGGNFSVSRDGGHTFAAWKPAAFTGGVASLLETADGALLAVGESGAVRLLLPEGSKP